MLSVRSGLGMAMAKDFGFVTQSAKTSFSFFFCASFGFRTVCNAERIIQNYFSDHFIRVVKCTVIFSFKRILWDFLGVESGTTVFLL